MDRKVLTSWITRGWPMACGSSGFPFIGVSCAAPKWVSERLIKLLEVRDESTRILERIVPCESLERTVTTHAVISLQPMKSSFGASGIREECCISSSSSKNALLSAAYTPSSFKMAGVVREKRSRRALLCLYNSSGKITINSMTFSNEDLLFNAHSIRNLILDLHYIVSFTPLLVFSTESWFNSTSTHNVTLCSNPSYII